MQHGHPDGDRDALARSVRDIVAISTLPALWYGAEPHRIAESLAAAVFTTIDPKLAFVAAATGEGFASIAQVGRYETREALARALEPRVLAWARSTDPDERHVVPEVEGTIIVRPIGHLGALGAIAVAIDPDYHALPTVQLLLNICTTQAAVAIRNSQLVQSLRRSEEAARAAERELREADRRKDEFLATLAHELRNPLAALRNVVGILSMRAGATTELRMEREILDRQIGHLTRLVDDLLDVARISRGLLTLRQDMVELRSVVDSAIESVRPLIEEKRHRLTVACPPDPVHVCGDAVRLGQVVTNLLNNAAKYTEPGGAITLAIERRGENAAIRVRDNGIGLSDAIRARVFDMFMQAEHPLTREGGGLGIGLTLARRLVDMHGGRIEASSDGPGRGSEFVVTLACAEPPRGCVASGAAQPAASPRRVLVVDDNRDAAESFALLLSLEGHEVRIAYDGEEAITAANAMRPDLIFMDIGMPKRNGYEAAQAIRAFDWAAATRMVAVTGWGQETDRTRSHAAGFDAHITKPIDMEQIGAFLRAAPGARVVEKAVEAPAT